MTSSTNPPKEEFTVQCRDWVPTHIQRVEARNIGSRAKAIGGPGCLPTTQDHPRDTKHHPTPKGYRLPLAKGQSRHQTGTWRKELCSDCARAHAFIPYVGWALLAYELFSLWRQGQEGVLPAGWEMQCGTTTAWVGGGSAGNNCGIPSQLAEKDLSGHTDIRWMEATHFPGQQPADWGTFWRGRIVGTARRVSGSGDFPGLQSGPPSTEPENTGSEYLA